MSEIKIMFKVDDSKLPMIRDLLKDEVSSFQVIWTDAKEVASHSNGYDRNPKRIVEPGKSRSASSEWVPKMLDFLQTHPRVEGYHYAELAKRFHPAGAAANISGKITQLVDEGKMQRVSVGYYK